MTSKAFGCAIRAHWQMVFHQGTPCEPFTISTQQAILADAFGAAELGVLVCMDTIPPQL